MLSRAAAQRACHFAMPTCAHALMFLPTQQDACFRQSLMLAARYSARLDLICGAARVVVDHAVSFRAKIDMLLLCHKDLCLSAKI